MGFGIQEAPCTRLYLVAQEGKLRTGEDTELEVVTKALSRSANPSAWMHVTP